MQECLFPGAVRRNFNPWTAGVLNRALGINPYNPVGLMYQAGKLADVRTTPCTFDAGDYVSLFWHQGGAPDHSKRKSKHFAVGRFLRAVECTTIEQIMRLKDLHLLSEAGVRRALHDINLGVPSSHDPTAKSAWVYIFDQVIILGEPVKNTFCKQSARTCKNGTAIINQLTNASPKFKHRRHTSNSPLIGLLASTTRRSL